jgi:hypothetical protein
VPELYDLWLDAVSTPKERVTTPEDWEPSDLAFDGGDWCGFAFTPPIPGRHFVWAIGNFYVPIFDPVGDYSEAGFWPGMGGVFDQAPIIQAGVDYYSVGDIGYLRMFYEFWPDGPHFTYDVFLYPFAPISVWVWQCDRYNVLDANGRYGCMWYENLEFPKQSPIIRSVDGGDPLGYAGESAEAIMEQRRGSPNLPNWWLRPVMWLYAVDSEGHWYNSDFDDNALINKEPKATARLVDVNLVEYERK